MYFWAIDPPSERVQSIAKVTEKMTVNLNSYAHIIWDWNGTLLNDAWLCVDVMNGMLRDHSLPEITLERYREIFDFPVKDYYLKLGFDFDKESFEIVGMDFMIRYNNRQNETALHPEARKILEIIRDKGIPQSILSAREENELRHEVVKLDVGKFFSLVYGLDDHYAHGKTDVGIRLIRDLAISPEKVLFIGDTLHDADVAKDLGVDCILVPEGHQATERLTGSGTMVVASLKDFIELL